MTSGLVCPAKITASVPRGCLPDDVEAVELEHVNEHLANVLGVVHDEDLGGHGGSPCAVLGNPSACLLGISL